MRTHRGRRSRRVPIAWKFFLLLVVLVPSLISVAWVGAMGMAEVNSRLDAVYSDAFARTQAIGHLAAAVERATGATVRLVAESDPATVDRLQLELRDQAYPAVDLRLSQLRSASGTRDWSDVVLGRRLNRAWDRFEAFTNTADFLDASAGSSPKDGSVERRVDALGRSLTGLVGVLDAREQAQAAADRQEAERAYSRGVVLLRLIVVLGLLVAVGATLWLIRAVVVRVKAYSAFARRVAAGELHSRTRPRGHDELTDLGWALNAMVAKGESVRSYEESQSEFTEALQVTEGEEEAHHLLKRHLERSVPGSAVVVLNRNNSADRLEATTGVPAAPGLAERLAAARPRDCVAVRLARLHQESSGTDPLISCGLCRHVEGHKACKPLLVGGEVIGSVLLSSEQRLDEGDQARVRDSVDQAAPVLANLRNLAIAELRAATDSLSGLPNFRAVQDTLKRLVAQASRMVWPLSAVLLDLDHFKQINDTFGHARGDEVLAAVGVVLQTTVRDSDFVGRYGGEEFIMLLPDTPREGAAQMAERVRVAIAEIGVLGDERQVTASFGVAAFPDDAPDVTRLVRNADRALYRAKANGRNRVELFSLEAAPDEHEPAPEDEDESGERAIPLDGRRRG
jgi:diguanylate cyclase (GGDEF)-like protein